MEIFRISKYIAVPLAAHSLYGPLVLYGTYRVVEKIFLVACGFYVAYILSAILAKPNWIIAAQKPGGSDNAPQFERFIGDDRADRDNDRALAILLLASGVRREARWSETIQTRAHGRASRQHKLHGDRVLHHCLHARRRCTQRE